MPKSSQCVSYIVLMGLCLNFSRAGTAAERVFPPAPLLPIPTARQMEWQNQELILFVHFGVNTFSNTEWGDGKEDPAIFNPVDLDAQQWARSAKNAGFKTIILTAKHHDGFCLWPSKYTDHSVVSSPWRNGKGDVVAELARACRDAGLKLGLYLSPWDRHETVYGLGPAYNRYYMGQLHELLTEYGAVSEIWFDGACGEGPNGKKQVYDFPAFWALVRQLQPGAVMFSDAGPDVRWIGNEHGYAGETCWSMMNRDTVAIGGGNRDYLNTGDVKGPHWVPGECDVSIRKGWFWHPDQDPKSVAALVDIYFKSVGRNGVLLLNVPPDTSGLLDAKDVQRLSEFRSALDEIFGLNLAKDAKAHSDQVRGNFEAYAAQQVLDERMASYWATDDSIHSATLEIDLGAKKTFNISSVREPVQFGQRVQTYHIEALVNGSWKRLASGTTIGNRKLDRFATVQARKLRLLIHEARACPLIAEWGLYFDKKAAE